MDIEELDKYESGWGELSSVNAIMRYIGGSYTLHPEVLEKQ
jgi:hypothetical protein